MDNDGGTPLAAHAAPVLSNPTRRAFIAGVAATSAASLLPGTARAAPSQNWATNLTALQASHSIRTGAVTAERYVAALLEQAEGARALDIFISGNGHMLLEAARDLDIRRRRGRPLGALAGVPLIIKDNIDTVAFPTTAGTPALADNRPAKDAAALAALLGADGLLFGKANMHELAFGVTSDNARYDAVHNAYAFDRIPGGSSGGTATGIAARVAPAGLGTDTGGSCRIPASLSGVVGLRPSGGRYPAAGVVPFSHTRDTIGPMARRVSDVALLDTLMSGKTYPAPRPLAGLRLGLPEAYFWSNLDPETEVVARDAVARLKYAGVEFVDVDLPGLQPLLDGIAPILPYEAVVDLRTYLAQSNTGLTVEQVVAQIASPDVQQGYQYFLSSPPSQTAYDSAISYYRPNLQALFADCYRQHNIEALCFPPTPITAPLIGQASVTLGGTATPVMDAYFHNENPGSAAGLPGLVLPAGLSRSGLPVGIEFDGLANTDSGLLAIGMACEKVLPPIRSPW